MTESTREVAPENRINCHDMVALRIVHVPFESDVVEIREIFGQLLGILPLLDDVLLLEPEPLPVHLSKVFNDQ